LSLPVPFITSWRAEIDGMRFSGMIEIERTDPRVWVEEELIGEIEDPFEAVKSRLHWH
jgi:hypothetical protein